MQPQILQKPELTLIGMEAPFIAALSMDANNFKVIPPLWERFSARAKEVPDQARHAMYGIVYGKPKDQRSHPDELQYLAAVAVNQVGPIPAGMVSHVIPPATYAVFLHKGPIRRIDQTCSCIYRQWLPESGYVQAPLPDVELYDDRFCGGGEDSVMEHWIAVKPKASSMKASYRRFPMTPDEQAIRDLQSNWIDAVNAKDLDRLLGWMTDDAAFLIPGRVSVGKAEFSAGFLAGHAQGRLHCTSEMEEVVVVGEVAYSRSWDSVSVTPAGGPAIRLIGHALTVWRKQPDGRWLLARGAALLSPVEGK